MGARGLEADAGLAVALLGVGAVVARRAADRDAERRRLGEHLVGVAQRRAWRRRYRARRSRPVWPLRYRVPGPLTIPAAPRREGVDVGMQWPTSSSTCSYLPPALPRTIRGEADPDVRQRVAERILGWDVHRPSPAAIAACQSSGHRRDRLTDTCLTLPDASSVSGTGVRGCATGAGRQYCRRQGERGRSKQRVYPGSHRLADHQQISSTACGRRLADLLAGSMTPSR